MPSGIAAGARNGQEHRSKSNTGGRSKVEFPLELRRSIDKTKDWFYISARIRGTFAVGLATESQDR